MESLWYQNYLFLIFLGFIMCSTSLCEANYTFYAGGKSGWVLNPSESYSHWSERNRFQVNDTIVFKYKLGTDSVLLVNRDDYFNCNKNKPILVLEHGNSIFKFEGSGPYYFISGHEDNCEKGQKLMVIVLSPNHKAHKAQTASSPSPNPEPAESIGPVSPAPAPASSGAPAGLFIGSSSGFSWSFIGLTIAVYIYMLI